jgi:hypothetical protein
VLNTDRRRFLKAVVLVPGLARNSFSGETSSLGQYQLEGETHDIRMGRLPDGVKPHQLGQQRVHVAGPVRAATSQREDPGGNVVEHRYEAQDCARCHSNLLVLDEGAPVYKEGALLLETVVFLESASPDVHFKQVVVEKRPISVPLCRRDGLWELAREDPAGYRRI